MMDPRALLEGEIAFLREQVKAQRRIAAAAGAQIDRLETRIDDIRRALAKVEEP